MVKLRALNSNLGGTFMRKLILAVAGLVALVTASVAVAHGIEGAKTAKAVVGTFSATSSNVSTRTCTTTDGKTLTITSGRYTGQASGDPDLAGAITLRARSVVNSDGVGVVDGTFRIDVASGRDTAGAFSTVYDHGKVAGLAAGRAHEPSARLVANLSAGFAPGSFTDGKLGGGTSGGSAVELGPGKCAPGPKPEKSEAKGTISALSANSITVAGVTCAIPSDKSAAVTASFKVNDRAEIHCSVQNGQSTLTRIEKRH
jgi:hypothetical protein